MRSALAVDHRSHDATLSVERIASADTSTEDTTTTAFDALRKGLEDMIEACDVVTEKFTAARDEFEANKK